MTPSALRVIGLAALLCAASPARAQDAPVDAVACDEVTELSSVYFADGSADLDDEARRRLAQNIEVLRACPGVGIRYVNGWINDCVGRDHPERSADLPFLRAQAVGEVYRRAGVRFPRLPLVRGRGGDPGVCPFEGDPSSDKRSRRVDTIPGDLASVRPGALATMPACSEIDELNSVYFADGSASLTTDAVARLAVNVAVLRLCPEISVSVNGWVASGKGAPRRAERVAELSHARAQAVADHYREAGVAAHRVLWQGRGNDPTVGASEDPEASARRSRRVDSILERSRTPGHPYDLTSAAGCAAVDELNSVYFADGSADLDLAALNKLAVNAQILRACPTLAVSVTGWRDTCIPDQSAAERSDTLPTRRARAVARYYVQARIGPGQIASWRGRGQDACAGVVQTADAPALGRRADSYPSPGMALSAARRTELASISCDTAGVLAEIPLDAPTGRPNALGRVRIAEASYVLRRCPKLRAAACLSPSQRLNFVRSSLASSWVGGDQIEWEPSAAQCIVAQPLDPDTAALVVTREAP